MDAVAVLDVAKELGEYEKSASELSIKGVPVSIVPAAALKGMREKLKRAVKK